MFVFSPVVKNLTGRDVMHCAFTEDDLHYQDKLEKTSLAQKSNWD